MKKIILIIAIYYTTINTLNSQIKEEKLPLFYKEVLKCYKESSFECLKKLFLTEEEFIKVSKDKFPNGWDTESTDKLKEVFNEKVYSKINETLFNINTSRAIFNCMDDIEFVAKETPIKNKKNNVLYVILDLACNYKYSSMDKIVPVSESFKLGTIVYIKEIGWKLLITPSY